VSPPPGPTQGGPARHLDGRAIPARERVLHPRQVSLVDILDRVLGKGVVIRGQVTLAAADIDLVFLDLALLVAAVDTAARR
jgi:hypothetical protein